MLPTLKKISLATLFILSYNYIKAQNIEAIKFNLPTVKVANSLYNKITTLDLRSDTTSLGIVQTGMFNNLSKAVAQQPLTTQFSNILSATIDDSAQKGELLLLLRQLNLSEITSMYSEKGYFGFGATLYVKKDSVYEVLGSMDTVAVVSAMDVTNKNIRTGSSIIASFIAKNLTKIAEGKQHYKYEELLNYEETAKKGIKLYNVNTYTDGCYVSYSTFSDQTPDTKITLVGNNREIKPGNVKIVSADGSLIKIKPGVIYAFVIQGKPYIVTPFGYYPIIKYNNDFFFTGKLSNTISNNNAVAMGIMFGAIGGAIAGATSTNKDLPYNVKILYSNGDFIRLGLAK